MYSIVIRCLTALQSDYPNKFSMDMIPYSYYHIIDYIPYTLLYIPMTFIITGNLYF